jgi:hypothetical protein
MEIVPQKNQDTQYHISLVPKLKLSPALVQQTSTINISLAPAVREATNKVKEQSSFFQQLSTYEIPTVESLVADDNIPVKGFNSHLPQMPLPIIEQGRNKALSKITSLLKKVNDIKNTLLKPEEEVICPYEQTKIKYLGRNYHPPAIADLTYPENFSIEQALTSTAAINASYYNVMLTHMQAMSAEAIDTNFAGITSENLGNAFAVLSATSTGNRYVINEKKLADHLEFAEIVRNLSMEDIIEYPKEVAYKLIHKFIEINSDIDISKDLPFFTSPVSIPNMDPIPQPLLEPQQAPRMNPLPIDHPALQYIAQPTFFGNKLPEKVLTK